MARITMRNSQKATFAQIFEVYISAVTARGVKDKTIATYKQHFHAISKRLDLRVFIWFCVLKVSVAFQIKVLRQQWQALHQDKGSSLSYQIPKACLSGYQSPHGHRQPG